MITFGSVWDIRNVTAYALEEIDKSDMHRGIQHVPAHYE